MGGSGYSRALTPVRVQEHAPGRSLFAVLICVLGGAEVICGLSGAQCSTAVFTAACSAPGSGRSTATAGSGARRQRCCCQLGRAAPSHWDGSEQCCHLLPIFPAAEVARKEFIFPISNRWFLLQQIVWGQNKPVFLGNVLHVFGFGFLLFHQTVLSLKS